MTNNKTVVKMPMSFSNEEADARKVKARDNLLNGTFRSSQYSVGTWTHPAADEACFTTLEQYISHIEQMGKEGRKRYPHILPVVSLPSFFSIAYYKSDEELNALIEKVETEAVEAYKQEIEQFNAVQKELLIQQLIEQEKAKELKKEQEREAKIRAAAERDAEEYFNSVLNKKEDK